MFKHHKRKLRYYHSQIVWAEQYAKEWKHDGLYTKAFNRKQMSIKKQHSKTMGRKFRSCKKASNCFWRKFYPKENYEW